MHLQAYNYSQTLVIEAERNVCTCLVSIIFELCSSGKPFSSGTISAMELRNC